MGNFVYTCQQTLHVKRGQLCDVCSQAQRCVALGYMHDSAAAKELTRFLYGCISSRVRKWWSFSHATVASMDVAALCSALSLHGCINEYQPEPAKCQIALQTSCKVIKLVHSTNTSQTIGCK